MGRRTFSADSYRSATQSYVPDQGPATARAEEQARRTGQLDPLVDPAGYGVIRRSLLRFEQRPDGLFELTIGTSMPVETRLDTTASMGTSVDIALRVLEQAFGLCSSVLPGYDLHMATGIFGDCVDQFVLCRPQFEMLAEKIVQQLTLMAPQRGGGGNDGEDPHYGIFGAAYLTAAYINRIDLKGYDFTISDEPARDHLEERELIRIFGSDVFDKVAANGFEIDRHNLPSTREVVQALLNRAHAFFLQVESRGYDANTTRRFWTGIYGPERVITLPRTELLPLVQAVIIGLTEGTLELEEVEGFLAMNGVSDTDAQRIVRSVSDIPIGAQAALPNYGIRPMQGDLFSSKDDLWPIGSSGTTASTHSTPVVDTHKGPDWL